jgi:hypothetical protein
LKNTYTSEIISCFVIIIEKQGYSKIKQMKEKLKNEKKKKKSKERIIRKNISNLFRFLEMKFHFLIII